MNAVVLGSGGWGTALAIALCDNGHSVTLWSHDLEKARILQSTRENPLLKGVEIPREIDISNDISRLEEAELAVFATPSFALRETAKKAAPYLPSDALAGSVTKGIDP